MTIKELSKGAKGAAKGAYESVMNHPKSTAAVVLGTGAAAALWWVLRKPERVAALRKYISERADAYREAREKRAA